MPLGPIAVAALGPFASPRVGAYNYAGFYRCFGSMGVVSKTQNLFVSDGQPAATASSTSCASSTKSSSRKARSGL